MQVQPCPSRAAWSAWLERATTQTPLVAHGRWGEMLEREQTLVEYFFVRDSEAIVGGFAMVPMAGRGVRYAYSPRSPIIAASVDVDAAFRCMSAFLSKKGMVFWRLEPELLPQKSEFAIRKTPDVQPAVTLVLDLSQTTDELLAAMHQKTRYNIRLAQKKNLEARWEKNPTLFWEMSTATSGRDGFRLHARAHYDEVIGSDFAEQLTVYADGKPVASAVFTLVGSVYTYLYGASSYEARALMAPYLVQWEGITRGKQRGAQWYDFYGLAPLGEKTAATRHLRIDEYRYEERAKEAGYTRFKVGFGGIVVVTPGTWDMVLKPFAYFVYRTVRVVRRFAGKLR